MHFLFFGTHPGISLLEIATFFGNPNEVVPEMGAYIQTEPERYTELVTKFGGCPRAGIKIGSVAKNSQNVEEETLKIFMQYLQQEQKKKFVVSLYGNAKQFLNARRIAVKVRKSEAKAKYAGKESYLLQSPATVFYLMQRNGVEFSVIPNKQNFDIVVTTFIQDPNYWSLVDFERPHREQFIGMLPSKLARIMVNVAKTKEGDTIWDPFVGLGTVLMEANLLKRYGIGSDIDAKTLEMGKENVKWLVQKGLTLPIENKFFVQDIKVKTIKETVRPQAIVTEPYLGAMRSKPFAEIGEAAAQWNKVHPLVNALLSTAESILQKGSRLVFVKPIYRYIDHGKIKWYNSNIRINETMWKRIIVSNFFEDNTWTQKDSTVGRELYVLEKKS